MKAVKDLLLDFFFPPKCIFCRKLLGKGEKDYCLSCSLDLPENDGIRVIPGAQACRAPLRYEGKARDAMIRYKFSGLSCYGPAFARLMVPLASSSGAELIVWIPVSFRRRLERGYDQTELIAKELSARTGIPAKKVLRKKHTGRQSAAGGPEARKRNVKGAFSVTDETAVRSRKLLLLDDVCTTGATLSEAVSVLNKAGAGEIFCEVAMMTQE